MSDSTRDEWTIRILLVVAAVAILLAGLAYYRASVNAVYWDTLSREVDQIKRYQQPTNGGE